MFVGGNLRASLNLLEKGAAHFLEMQMEPENPRRIPARHKRMLSPPVSAQMRRQSAFVELESPVFPDHFGAGFQKQPHRTVNSKHYGVADSELRMPGRYFCDFQLQRPARISVNDNAVATTPKTLQLDTDNTGGKFMKRHWRHFGGVVRTERYRGEQE